MGKLIPRRKMTWLIIVFSALLFAWMIGGAAEGASQNAADCAKDSGSLSYQTCLDASNAGTGIGVALVFVLWFIGFVVLSLIWFMTRAKHRQCPACGEDVKKGLTACRKCGHDFAAAVRQPATA